jgi:hypothetical protein
MALAPTKPMPASRRTRLLIDRNLKATWNAPKALCWCCWSKRTNSDLRDRCAQLFWSLAPVRFHPVNLNCPHSDFLDPTCRWCNSGADDTRLQVSSVSYHAAAMEFGPSVDRHLGQTPQPGHPAWASRVLIQRGALVAVAEEGACCWSSLPEHQSSVVGEQRVNLR